MTPIDPKNQIDVASFRFIQAFQVFWQFRCETKLFFSVSESQKPEKYQRFKSSCEVEMRRLEEDAAQQKLELEAAQKDLSVFLFLGDAQCWNRVEESVNLRREGTSTFEVVIVWRCLKL